MARPPFIPSDEQRRYVRSMAAFGIRQEDIAKVVGFRSLKTLRKHFSKEMESGRIDANCKVLQTLYEMATSGEDVAATIFWAKTRLGFQETRVAENRPAVISFVVAEDKEAA